MQRLLLLSLFLSPFLLDLSAQCENGRYRDLIFQDFTLTSDLLYGNNINNAGDAQDLYLDVYEPAGDTEVDRPLVVVSHGGSFVSGTKDGPDVEPICRDLAKMGYVVASIQYRLGISIIGDLNVNATSAVVRGVQDSRAAIRYFRKDVAENDNTYNIDPEKIFMLGSSAGGFNALHVAYMDQVSEIPSIIDTTQAGLGGGVEGESGNPGYSSAIAGVVNIAGALSDPEIMENNDTPVCSFHGTGDSVVPFGSDVLTFFGVIEVDSVHGSQTIHEQADQLGIENCFFVQWLEGHVPHVANSQHYDTLRSITSNFLSHLVCTDVELDCDYRQINVIVSSTEEWNSNANNFNLWPNPAQNVLKLKGANADDIQFRILDVTGTEVKKGTYHAKTRGIPIEELPNGVYLIRLENSAGIKTLRFNKSS